ncbi:MAG: ABC transporter permease [Thermoanaerobaculia bacterium]|nr:ABC transporter permease [Thermoanaerobaculia bacterium]
MLRFVFRRLASAILLLYLVLTTTFFFIQAVPGEPERLYENPRISEEATSRIRAAYGLDRPVHEQYFRWLGSVLQGDWGTSFSAGRPVFQVLSQRLPATVVLVLAGVGIELGAGFLLAVAAVRSPGGRFDRAARWFSVLFYSTPVFVVGIVLIEVFAVQIPIFPAQQMMSADAASKGLVGKTLDLLSHLALPALALGLVRCGPTLRFLRNSLLEVLDRDYIRTARTKGLSESRVLWFHAVPNAVAPIIQRLGVSLPLLLSSTLVLEIVFSWPGLGTAIYSAIFQRDYPVVLATTAMSAVLVVAGSLAADLAHAWVDPRIRDRV